MRLVWILPLLCVLSLPVFVTRVEGFTRVPCATPLSSYKGVSARSNQSDPFGSCAGKSQYGLRFQCVEYVRRFYHLIKGIETREGMTGDKWNGDASTYFQTANEKGLDAFSNGGSVPPQADDIITFQGGLYGHVAVITVVTNEYIEFIEQNLSRTGTGRLAYDAATHRVANRDVPGGKLTLKGWLRPRFN